MIVVTHGADGCTVYTQDRKMDVPGFPAEEVDPTGAGDCFDAGFLVRWLAGDPPQRTGSEPFMGFRQATLPGGTRIIDAYNSSGLTFTLLPDRGMDIWQATYQGHPLAWLSQGSPWRRQSYNV